MTDNRTTELLPCPYCGKVDTLEFATRRELEDCPNFDDCEAETCGRGFCDVYDNWDCVVCSVYKGGCGASGGYDECPAKAIEKWNTRTPEQAIAATLGNHPTKSVRGYYTDRDDDGTHIMCDDCGGYIGTAEEIAATLGSERTCERVLYKPTGVLVCSECGAGMPKQLDKYCYLHYCPNCGKRIRKKVDE